MLTLGSGFITHSAGGHGLPPGKLQLHFWQLTPVNEGLLPVVQDSPAPRQVEWACRAEFIPRNKPWERHGFSARGIFSATILRFTLDLLPFIPNIRRPSHMHLHRIRRLCMSQCDTRDMLHLSLRLQRRLNCQLLRRGH